MDRPLRTLVATGDSFTEGLADELGPAGRHLGWADRVAAALATRDGGLRYANLAVRGRLLDQVVTEQLPVARALRPDLLTFHAGANDVLRPGRSVPEVVDRYRAAVAALRDEDITTLLFTVVERAGGSGRTAERLAARFAAFNIGIREVASDTGALLVDQADAPALRDRRLWHEDRLHLAPDGHRRVAAAVLERIGVDDADLIGGEKGWWREPLDLPSRAGRRADVVADVRWVRRHLLPWVGRRLRGVSSGDTVVAKHAELVDVLPKRGAATGG